jgi:hypothetical protein
MEWTLEGKTVSTVFQTTKPLKRLNIPNAAEHPAKAGC